MALIDKESVKKILQISPVDKPNVFNEPAILNLYADSQLDYSNIDDDSESVKIIRQTVPYTDSHNPITLNAGVPVALDHQKIVPDSVTVALTPMIVTVYTENLDYVIDYFNGTIVRASTGSNIPDGGTVHVYYLPFTVLSADDDYDLDNNPGKLQRRAGSIIPDGATVYIDYSHSQATISDLAIEATIEQAEAFIEPRLKSQFNLNSNDRGLKSAATYFCVHLLSLSMSLKELHNAPRDISDDLAKQWQNLADRYYTVAKSHFSKYLRTTGLEYGGVIQNRYPTSRPSRYTISPSLSRTERRY